MALDCVAAWVIGENCLEVRVIGLANETVKNRVVWTGEGAVMNRVSLPIGEDEGFERLDLVQYEGMHYLAIELHFFNRRKFTKEMEDFISGLFSIDVITLARRCIPGPVYFDLPDRKAFDWRQLYELGVRQRRERIEAFKLWCKP